MNKKLKEKGEKNNNKKNNLNKHISIIDATLYDKTNFLT
jgi:hypothetical protein